MYVPNQKRPQLLLSLRFLLVVIFCLFTLVPHVSFAEIDTGRTSPMMMRITPPYFSVALAPGDTWESLVKFSNGGAYPLTVKVYAQNFRTNGGSGIEFFEQSSELTTLPYELAAWVTLPTRELVVPPGATIQIPFRIVVPKEAEPGGHYAGIVVDTSMGSVPGGMGVSSALSSLLLVRVSGETIESGFIRDFKAVQFITQSQSESFILEFKNTGNVHIEPKGEVEIINMFGKVRGQITLQSGNSFGHILPFSTKQFTFLWQGETNYLDIGLYRARATLYYGDQGEKVAYHSTYFLVFPWLPALCIISFLIVFTRFLRIGAKRYVKRAMQIERERTRDDTTSGIHAKTLSVSILERPFMIGVREFLAIGIGKKRTVIHGLKIGEKATYATFFRTYRPFFVYIVVFTICFALIGYYFYQVFASERAYQVSIKRGEVVELAPESREE